jgi:transcriptional regulator with XRE-family HTH domain
MATTDPATHTRAVTSTGNGTSAIRREELAEFLRGRRARISPTDVGLSPGIRRRTPGLRREEVAQLAGVGVTWYTWLEQGRPINASAQVLDAVARTLRLDQAEREHLYRLADASTPPPETAATVVSPAVEQILESLDPLPASLTNSRYDVLASNKAHEDLFWRWQAMPCERRNILVCCFLQPDARKRFVNFDTEVPRLVATLRARFAQHLNEPGWTSFIKCLIAASPEFAEMWARHEVANPGTRTKHFLHPDAGLLRMRSTSLAVTDMPEAFITVYTPADEDTRRRLPLTRRS